MHTWSLIALESSQNFFILRVYDVVVVKIRMDDILLLQVDGVIGVPSFKLIR